METECAPDVGGTRAYSGRGWKMTRNTSGWSSAGSDIHAFSYRSQRVCAGPCAPAHFTRVNNVRNTLEALRMNSEREQAFELLFLCVLVRSDHCQVQLLLSKQPLGYFLHIFGGDGIYPG